MLRVSEPVFPAVKEKVAVPVEAADGTGEGFIEGLLT
jgi:hypothetical protein